MSGPAELQIRLARPDEREELEALQWRASLANENDRPHLEANPDAIHLPPEQIERGEVFVADLDGRVVGFAAILVETGHIELDGLFVDPELWGRGFGRSLVNVAIHEARRQGLAMKVIANRTALGFYKKCGFKIEGEAETRFGPALRMSR
jgi:GNAT superfamily N-acetyltransferase